MQIEICKDVIIDSRRVVLLPRQETLVIADLFIGLGAARRRKPEMILSGQYNKLLERLFGIINDFKPHRIVLLGDVKPNKGFLDDRIEQDELKSFFSKLQNNNREIIQVVRNVNAEKIHNYCFNNINVKLVNSFRIGLNTLIYRRRTFVYPKHDPFNGFWINGGLHPIFSIPIVGNNGSREFIHYPTFLYTGFALSIPSFASNARGWEIIQPERLPKNTKVWKIIGDHYMIPIDPLSGKLS